MQKSSTIVKDVKKRGEMMDTQLVKAKLKYRNKTYQEIATALRMNRDTFARRINTGKFNVQNVKDMMKAIPLTMKAVEEIFFK